MKIFVALNHDIEHSDVLGVYRTEEAALKVPGVNDVEAFDLDDVDEGEWPKGHRFLKGKFGRISGEFVCHLCGDIEAKHLPTSFAPMEQVSENPRTD